MEHTDKLSFDPEYGYTIHRASGLFRGLPYGPGLSAGALATAWRDAHEALPDAEWLEAWGLLCAKRR